MSSVYATEPATSGRVVFETTHGPLEIQLWCRECPATTKLFLQLCLDGYYNDMLFHRIVPSFLIQTGAMRHPSSKTTVDSAALKTYRQNVKADEALERRKYEINSRLQFNHRGQVAMALGVDDDDEEDGEDLQPQFFITLEEADFLNRKHVLFGTVIGPTVFNALRIGTVEVDKETNQPVDLEHAPRIQSVKIIDNPLHQDIVPQKVVPWTQEKKEMAKKEKKRKGVKNVNVLSFGDEMAEDDEDAGRIKSSHDVIESHTLSKQVDKEVEGALQNQSTVKAAEKRDRSRREEKEEQNIISSSLHSTSSTMQNIDFARKDPSQHARSEKAGTATEPMVSKDQVESVTAAPSTSIVEARKAKYSKGRKSKKQREGDTMAKLMSFQSKVREQAAASKSSKSAHGEKDDSLASRMARRAQQATEEPDKVDDGPAYHGQVLESDDEDKDETKVDWLQTRFKCRRHIDHRAGGDGRNMDDYEVVDERERSRGSDHHSSSKYHHKRHKKHHHRDRKEDRHSHKHKR